MKTYSTLLISLILFQLNAQEILFEKKNIKPGTQTFIGVGISGTALGDIDGDGDIDLIIAGNNEELGSTTNAYLNNGDGNFERQENNIFKQANFASLALFDVDEDGDEDCILIGSEADNKPITDVYLNDGNGFFKEDQNNQLEKINEGCIAYADVDGDLDQDILIIGFRYNNDPKAYLYLNDGQGQFVLDDRSNFVGVKDGALSFFDVDNDDDLDLTISGLSSDQTRLSTLYINDGNGLFEKSPQVLVGVSDGAMCAADLDGDSDIDLIVSGYSDEGSITIQYMNDGLGNFSMHKESILKGMFNGDIAIDDIDADGDMDLLTNGNDGLGSNIRSANLYFNDGDGSFKLREETQFQGTGQGTIDLSDLDGDGRLDVLITGITSSNHYASHLYFQLPGGSFTEIEGMPLKGVYYSAHAYSDVDDDGDLDLFVSGLNSDNKPTAYLYVNDGLGNYERKTGTNFTAVERGTAHFMDLNSDGEKELFITGRDQYGNPTAELYVRNGPGSFTKNEMTSFKGIYDGSVAFGDIDHDSDVDIILSGKNENSSSNTYIYKNNGEFKFNSEDLNQVGLTGLGAGLLRLSDFNGDHFTDLIYVGGEYVRCYLNDSNGLFSLASEWSLIGSQSIDIADTNLDGYVDLVIAGSDYENTNFTKIYLNRDGLGFEEIPSDNVVNVFSSVVKFTDIDGDTDPDLFVMGMTGISNTTRVAELYENIGDGQFELVETSFFDGGWGGSATFLDFDNNETQDLIISNFGFSGASIHTYINNSELKAPIPVNILSTNQIERSLIVYPNPNSGQFNLSSSPSQSSYRLIDLNGKSCSISITDNQISVEVRPGTYILEIRSSLSVEYKKIIVK